MKNAMVNLGIDADTWTELSALLDSALDLPPPQRASWLASLEPRYEPLKPWLRDLLARAAELETSDFLESLPPLELEESSLPAAGTGDTRVGPYRLVRELGRGGMGTVWLAQRADGLFNRPVALKFPQGVWVREGLRERMARERELLAALEHPGIARLYDAGLTDAGIPYLALEYVDGVPLDQYCRRERLDVRRKLSLFVRVADAVAYAHTKLIIHRDLKPSNILVGAGGEVRLLDFGIAKLLDEHGPPGRVTEVAGPAFTPDYASPEQIAGRPLTVATDVYSLGVVLYELLTGTRPYQLRRDSRGALEDAILEVDPRRPSQVAPRGPPQRQLRGDLDAVVLKALKKAPEERYPTVDALVEDIRRHLTGHPVSARPDGHGYRLRRFLWRHKLSTAAAAVASTAVIAGAGVALWQAELAREEADRAEDVTRFVTSIFQGVDPRLLGAQRPLTATEVLDQAQQRVAAELGDRPAMQMQLRAVIARSYLGLYEPRRARELLAATLDEAATLPEPDADVMRALHLLMAEAALELVELDDAERHLDLAMEIEGRDPGAGSVAAGIVRSGIAYQRGQYELAAKAAEDALAIAEPIRDLDPALLMDAYTSVGKAAGMQRDTERSLDYNRRAFEAALTAFGGDREHPKVLEYEHNYAASLIDVGKIDEAVPHLEHSLEAARKTYGENSLIAGQYAVRLGLVLMERGELESAIELISAGNRIEEAFETGDSPSKSGRQRTLARAYLAARRIADAAREIDRAVQTMRPIDSPVMKRVLEADQAFLQAAAFGELKPSMARLEKVIEAQDHGDQRYKTHLPDIYLGVLHLWQGDSSRAMVHLGRGVELARAQTRLSDLGEALVFLGLARLDAGDDAGAGPVLGEGLELLQSAQVAETPAHAEAGRGLGRAALQSGDVETALDWLQRCEGFWARFDPENHRAGTAAFWLGRVQMAANQPRAATASFGRAAELLARSPLPVDTGLASRAREWARRVPVAVSHRASDPAGVADLPRQ